MKVTDDIINKIRKCLALANGLNATPDEMSTAMAKAKEIAMRHGIEIASINLAEGKDAADGLDVQRSDVKLRSKKEQLYHRAIYQVLMEVFGVRIVRMWGAVCFIGEATDVAICRELFPWLEDVFYSTYYKAKKEGKVQSCAAHKNGIYFGLSAGIIRANKQEEAKLNKQEAGTMAMVLVSKTALIERRMNEEFPKLRTPQARQKRISDNAYGIGFEKGKSIRLNQTASGAPAHGQLN